MAGIIPILVAAATFFSTMFGGYLALKHGRDLFLFIAFAGGALVSIAFFDLLPTAIGMNLGSTNWVLVATMVGFLYYHVIQRGIAAHNHARAMHEQPAPVMGKVGAGTMVLHSFFDGVGIGFGFQVSYAVGALVAFAVIAHDFSDGLNTTTMMLRHGNTKGAAKRFLEADAIAPMIGVLASFMVPASSVALSYILAFFAGEFLSIGASDLLPEAHTHEKSWRMIGLTMLGAAVIFAVTRFA
ncbi:MAG: ZIP family metal transporter [Nitrososphaerota archaeon]|nr:ZIP family metal transporter [Nitrososphaerota archaeon]